MNNSSNKLNKVSKLLRRRRREVADLYSTLQAKIEISKFVLDNSHLSFDGRAYVEYDGLGNYEFYVTINKIYNSKEDKFETNTKYIAELLMDELYDFKFSEYSKGLELDIKDYTNELEELFNDNSKFNFS